MSRENVLQLVRVIGREDRAEDDIFLRESKIVSCARWSGDLRVNAA